MATSSGRRSPTILFSLALCHDGLISDQDQDDDKLIVIDEQIARTIRGYVDILSPLASRMVEFDLDADAQTLVEDVQAFCAQLTSACSRGPDRPCLSIRLQDFECEYLRLRLEMDYFIRIRECTRGDPKIIRSTGDEAEDSNTTADAIEILDTYSYMQRLRKRQRLTNETSAS